MYCEFFELLGREMTLGETQEETYGKTATGLPITDGLIAERAGRAEAGCDVDEVLRRRGGRPPIEAAKPDLRWTCDDGEA